MVIRRNVLIFHAAALGDFVLSWPLGLALGRLYAQSRIIYVTGAQKGALAERALGVESTDIEAGWHALHGEQVRLPERCERLLAGAHTLIHFAGRADSRWEANVRRLAPAAEVLWVHPNPPADQSIHASQYVLSQLRGHRMIAPALEQMLRSVQQRGIGLSRRAGNEMMIHPGAGSPAKRWSLERFIELIRALRGKGQVVRALLGEVERERWSETEVAALRDVAPVQLLQTPLELLDQLLPARLVIANDSGPAHLAGICGIPTIVLFGPTDPRQWHPLGPHVRTIHRQRMEDIGVPDVMELVAQADLVNRGDAK